MTQETMTKEQIIKSKYPCYDENLTTRDVELCGEQVQELMEEYAQQQVSAERERAGKLVEALRTISNHYPEWDHISGEYTSQIIAQQTINEYDTATKES